MNAKTLIALALLASSFGAASAAFAAGDGDITQDTTPFVSTRSRAEVRAEALAARANNAIVSGQLSSYVPAAAHSEKSRQEVRDEVRQARATRNVYRGGDLPQM